MKERGNPNFYGTFVQRLGHKPDKHETVGFDSPRYYQMNKDVLIEEIIKRLKKAAKVLLKEDKNYQHNSYLQKLNEAANIINK